MVKDSRVNFIGNRIYQNESVGIFVRDKCKGVVKENEVNHWIFFFLLKVDKHLFNFKKAHDNKIDILVENR